jgi:hypothetical protein
MGSAATCVCPEKPAEVPAPCKHDATATCGYCAVHAVKSFVCIHCGAEAFCPTCDEGPTPKEVWALIDRRGTIHTFGWNRNTRRVDQEDAKWFRFIRGDR